MPKYVYQLVATGEMRFFPSSSSSVRTTTVFTSEAEAEKRIPAFETALKTDESMGALDRFTIRIKRLEIVE